MLKFTGGKGVNVLYDNIANSKVLPQAFKALGIERPSGDCRRAWRAELVMIDFAHLYHKKITIMGRTGHNGRRHPEMLRCGGGRQDSRRRSRSCCRSRAPREAHRLVESGEVAGKIVLDPTLDR